MTLWLWTSASLGTAACLANFCLALEPCHYWATKHHRRRLRNWEGLAVSTRTSTSILVRLAPGMEWNGADVCLQRFIVLLSTKHGRTRASHGVQGFTFGTGKRRVRADLTRDPGPRLHSGRYLDAMRVYEMPRCTYSSSTRLNTHAQVQPIFFPCPPQADTGHGPSCSGPPSWSVIDGP